MRFGECWACGVITAWVLDPKGQWGVVGFLAWTGNDWVFANSWVTHSPNTSKWDMARMKALYRREMSEKFRRQLSGLL
jgi:hypothetical protein